MDFLEALVLGLVQGLTEFLPISSTAHLRIVPALLGWEDPGAAFTAVTQLGTVAAVVLFFRGDLLRIVRASLAALRQPRVALGADARLGLMITAGTVPIGVFGLAFKDQIETGARDLRLIGAMLIVMGLVLLAAERVGQRRRDLTDLSVGQGLLIGLAQAVALVPGVSRSGSTISAGLFLGLDRVSAARFSFLLSVPAVVLAGLFELKGLLDGSTTGPTPDLGATALATLTAFVVGYASIAVLLRFLGNHSTGVFIAYRIALGTLVLTLVGVGAL
jgi:undecaprenyl-diphosphatase